MNKLMIASLGMLMAASGAMAQTAAPTTSQDKPAVAMPDSKNPDAPVAGSNSFTEAQAQERFEDAGFTAVTGLKLDEEGIWRAAATKDGKSVEVALDYQGNIVTK
ncbi:MAG: PepSY domain-containing protein [Allorhizobium sp.]